MKDLFAKRIISIELLESKMRIERDLYGKLLSRKVIIISRFAAMMDKFGRFGRLNMRGDVRD